MTASVFARMHDRLLTRLGEEAFLRQQPCRVNIEYGVVVNYEPGDDKFVQSEYAAVVDIANIPKGADPKPGDTLTTAGDAYVIDAIASDNGYLVRCILRPAP